MKIFPGSRLASHDIFIFSDEGGERITVISITPHHPPTPSSGSSPIKSNNSLRKSSLKQSSKYSDSSTLKSAQSASTRHQRQREPSDESNFEEYQIEGERDEAFRGKQQEWWVYFWADIEREILRKSPGDDHLEDPYNHHGQYSSSENRRSVNTTENKTGNLNFSRKQDDSRWR